MYTLGLGEVWAPVLKYRRCYDNFAVFLVDFESKIPLSTVFICVFIKEIQYFSYLLRYWDLSVLFSIFALPNHRPPHHFFNPDAQIPISKKLWSYRFGGQGGGVSMSKKMWLKRDDFSVAKWLARGMWLKRDDFSVAKWLEIG